MKKLLTILCTILCLLTLGACASQNEQSGENNTSEVKNMGDAILAQLESNVSGWEMTSDHIKVITDDYVYEATLTPELSEKLDAIDFMAEDRDQKYAEILAALPVEKATPRSEFALTDEKIASLIGKKGQELLDLGYEYYGYNLGEQNAQFFIYNNGYNYTVTVEEHYDDSDTFDAMEVLPTSTIKDIQEQ